MFSKIRYRKSLYKFQKYSVLNQNGREEVKSCDKSLSFPLLHSLISFLIGL